MKYKAVCFDIDATLYPRKIIQRYMASFVLFHPCVNSVYSKMRAEFRKVQGSFEETDLKNLDFETREATMLFRVTEGTNRAFKTVEKARQYLENKYYKRLKRRFKKIPFQADTVETFKFLKENNVKIGVFSDWPLENKLHDIGVESYVDYVASPYETGYLKPDVHCFDSLLQNLKEEADTVLYVGDSYSKDIEGAYNAGIDAVMVNSKDSEISKYPKAMKVFKNWAEFDIFLREFLKKSPINEE